MFNQIGDFQVSLLQCLVTIGGQAKGFELENCMEEFLDREILAPQVLGALKRLEKRECVELIGSEQGEKGGRPRNIYSITELGRSVLTGVLEEQHKRQQRLATRTSDSERLAEV